jgi:hypothetical protein
MSEIDTSWDVGPFNACKVNFTFGQSFGTLLRTRFMYGFSRFTKTSYRGPSRVRLLAGSGRAFVTCVRSCEVSSGFFAWKILEKKNIVYSQLNNTAAGGRQRRSGAEAELERIAARRQLFWWLVRAAPASRQFAVASLEELRAVRKSAARAAAASMPHGPWNQLQSR